MSLYHHLSIPRPLTHGLCAGTLALSLLVLGVAISLFSTHRSVVKYLKMKLDDLY